jgi:hypothetical protein
MGKRQNIRDGGIASPREKNLKLQFDFAGDGNTSNYLIAGK